MCDSGIKYFLNCDLNFFRNAKVPCDEATGLWLWGLAVISTRVKNQLVRGTDAPQFVKNKKDHDRFGSGGSHP